MSEIPPLAREILERVAADHMVRISQIVGPIQTRPVVAARHAFLRACYATGQWSVKGIARFFDLDHTTVLYAIGSRPRKPLIERRGWGIHETKSDDRVG